jgi:hypothetical protein
MWDLCRLLWRALVGLFRSRAALEAENVVLRQQVIVLRRTTPRKPVFSSIDRLIFVGLHRLFSNVGEALAIIKPETVVSFRKCDSERDRFEGATQDVNAFVSKVMIFDKL